MVQNPCVSNVINSQKNIFLTVLWQLKNPVIQLPFERSWGENHVYLPIFKSITESWKNSRVYMVLGGLNSRLNHVSRSITWAMSTRLRIFFSAKIFLRIRKFSRPHAAYSSRFQPSTRIRLYPENFWFALVPSSFAGDWESWSEHAHNSDFGAISFATARCKQSKLVIYHSHDGLFSLNVRSQLFC